MLCVRGKAHDLSVDERSRRLGPSETNYVCRQPGTEVPGRTKTSKRNILVWNSRAVVSILIVVIPDNGLLLHRTKKNANIRYMTYIMLRWRTCSSPDIAYMSFLAPKLSTQYDRLSQQQLFLVYTTAAAASSKH